jgi:cytosine/adenosine deaminase-related metal-dependent hydrolase
VGIGVDGSASNDGSHLIAEARLAMLLQRALGNPTGLTGEEALWLATRGGASVLRRDDIGQLAPDKAADLIAINLQQLPYAGATHDPLNALTFCAPQNVQLSIINGKVTVQDGRLLTLDLAPHVERHNRVSHRLIRGE